MTKQDEKIKQEVLKEAGLVYKNAEGDELENINSEKIYNVIDLAIQKTHSECETKCMEDIHREVAHHKQKAIQDTIKQINEATAKKFNKLFGISDDDLHETDKVDLSNEALSHVIEGMYYTPDGNIRYDFSIIDADVLGSVYEQYLGHLLKKTPKRAKIEEKHNHRKEQGIYYTPAYIVDYIIRNTLGELIKDKRPSEVEKIKVLDPACGSGSFLIKAFDVLNEYYSKHDKHYNQSKLDPESEKAIMTRKTNILTSNLYGVDLDSKAVEIAQLNLLLKTADKKHRLPQLKENIKHGNSLIEDKSVSPQAFDWNSEFKSTMDNGGFDVVIGNPPYERTLYLEDEKQYYSQNYTSAYGAYDILILFVEKAIRLLKNDGYLGFIVSNKFLVSDYGKKLREFLLSNCKIIKIIDLADAKRVFPDALVSTAIIILQKTVDRSDYNIRRFIADKDTTTFDEMHFENVPLDKFVAENGSFNVRYQPRKDTIYKRINHLKKFGEVFDIRTGIMGFEYWKMEPYIHEGKQNKNDIRIATNSYLDRYRFLWNKEINLYKKKFTEPYANVEDIPINENTKKLFLTKNKLIVRGVSKKLTAMIDEEGVGFLVAVHSILIDEGHYPKFVLGILNSKLFDWIHKDRFYLGRIPEGSLKYPVSFLKELPFPADLNRIDNKKFISLVDEMLTLNKRLNELGDKQNNERQEVEDDIKKTDAKIDELVYKLYEITDEEKKVIESSPFPQDSTLNYMKILLKEGFVYQKAPQMYGVQGGMR